MRQLESQREAVGANLDSLTLIRDDLDSRLKNLSADPDTISVYAHELGYVAEGERLIKLAGFAGGVDRAMATGQAIRITKPEHLPEWVCKLIALVCGAAAYAAFEIQKARRAHAYT